MTLNLLEIRNYLLKPDILEHFIDYFETHFVFSLQKANMPVLGQFRLIGDPTRFVFLRGFPDMQTRLASLQSYYNGAFWEQYGPFVNDLMLEWHNVHLLCPLAHMDDLTCGLDTDTIAADLAAGTISSQTGVIALDYYQAHPGQCEALIDRFQAQVVPVYQQQGIQVRGLFVAEMQPNDFPRLPVIQNPDELGVFTAYESEAACRQQREKLSSIIHEAIGALLSTAPESLLLSPTLRSPLRYVRP